ncbi:hypothetical protein PSN_2713 [Pseudomonas sp. NGC7]
MFDGFQLMDTNFLQAKSWPAAVLSALNRIRSAAIRDAEMAG